MDEDYDTDMESIVSGTTDTASMTSDPNYIFDEILEAEEDGRAILTDKTNYIGLYFHDRRNNLYLLASTVRATTLYKYDLHDIVNYVRDFSIMRIDLPNIDILQLNILNDGTYSVVIKTHWLRLVQRRWKSIMRQRDAIIMQRMHSSHNKLLTSVYKCTDEKLPGLRGICRIFCKYK